MIYETPFKLQLNIWVQIVFASKVNALEETQSHFENYNFLTINANEKSIRKKRLRNSEPQTENFRLFVCIRNKILTKIMFNKFASIEGITS